VFLARTGMVVRLAGENGAIALRLRFLEASTTPRIAAARRDSGRVNYLLGRNPDHWQTNLRSYREIVYRGLWPGVDLRMRGGGGKLEYEFRLAPGADPGRVRLAYRGQDRLSIEPSGGLRIETALGPLEDSAPLSYQPIGGRRVAVASKFTLGRGGAFGFALGSYDHRYPLVIDPGLAYSTFLGESGHDHGYGIAVDAAGDAYVTGLTESMDFPTTARAFDRSYNGRGGDAFVTKLNASGSALVYTTFLGGRRNDFGYGIAVDRAGNAYVTGSTKSRNFPTTRRAFDRSYNRGGWDAFVTKLNPAGTALVYSTYLGEKVGHEGHGIAIDQAGNAYVTGRTESVRFPTTPGAFDPSYNGGGGDAFVAKVSASGSSLGYSTFIGGAAYDFGRGIAVDPGGHAYVTGSASAGFPATADAYDGSYNGGRDAFVAKLNAFGSSLVYSTYLGAESADEADAIAVDRVGSAYVAGRTGSGSFPATSGSFDRSYNGGGGDAFVAKLNPTGRVLDYSTYLGGDDLDFGKGIALDRFGRAYVTGATSSEFPTTAGAIDRSYNGGGYDAFLTELDRSGSGLRYSTYLGGSAGDWGNAVAVARGSPYLTGTTWSSGFPRSADAFDRNRNGNDAFVTKLRRVR
jgi:Beta-propeller repeat